MCLPLVVHSTYLSKALVDGKLYAEPFCFSTVFSHHTISTGNTFTGVIRPCYPNPNRTCNVARLSYSILNFRKDFYFLFFDNSIIPYFTRKSTRFNELFNFFVNIFGIYKTLYIDFWWSVWYTIIRESMYKRR